MFQLSFAFEARVKDVIVTISSGWGFGLFTAGPWYTNIIGRVRQGAPGIERVGFFLLGFFLTFQIADVLKAQKAIARSTVSSALARGLRSSTAKVGNGS